MKNIRKFGQIPMGRFGLSGLFKRKNNKTSNFSIRDNESGEDYFERFKTESGITNGNKKALETITSDTNFDSRLKNLDNKIKAANHMIEGRIPKVNKADDDDINSMFGDIALNNLAAIQEEPKLTRRLRFARAFGDARRLNLQEFEFEGGRYGTLLADEVKSKNLVPIPGKGLVTEEADKIIDSENASTREQLENEFLLELNDIYTRFGVQYNPNLNFDWFQITLPVVKNNSTPSIPSTFGSNFKWTTYNRDPRFSAYAFENGVDYRRTPDGKIYAMRTSPFSGTSYYLVDGNGRKTKVNL